jgi:hypothetical protein
MRHGVESETSGPQGLAIARHLLSYLAGVQAPTRSRTLACVAKLLPAQHACWLALAPPANSLSTEYELRPSKG